jgi:hypothetical protein
MRGQDRNELPEYSRTLTIRLKESASAKPDRDLEAIISQALTGKGDDARPGFWKDKKDKAGRAWMEVIRRTGSDPYDRNYAMDSARFSGTLNVLFMWVKFSGQHEILDHEYLDQEYERQKWQLEITRGLMNPRTVGGHRG